jgi:hypothetical protein
MGVAEAGILLPAPLGAPIRPPAVALCAASAEPKIAVGKLDTGRATGTIVRRPFEK